MRWLFIACSAVPLLFLAALHGADGPPSKHWSMRPRSQPAVPKFEDPVLQAQARTPVDAYLLARLQSKGLRFAPEADARTLIRRLTFDLTGLPPTVDEIDHFVNRASAKPQAAYEELVDRLLASPRYGERWGRYWLDVVRFAETEGFEYDRQRVGAWRYRDYVINSFNTDKPFDQFVIEQLAGDEMEAEGDPKKGTGTSKTRSQSPFSDLQIAAGFHRLGPVRRNAGNQELAFSRHEVLTEMTDIIGNALLGLTVGCARCHDHKFDRISQEDYYCLQAFLASTQERDIVLVDDKTKADWKAKYDAIQKEIKTVEKSLEKLKGTERDRAEEKLRDLKNSLPAPLPSISTVLNVEAERTPIHLLRRGDTDKKDRQVGPRVLSAFTGSELRELSPDMSNPRTSLARWIIAKDNPLTARVMVNRIWQGHFGKGIVGTPNDFGVNGSAPSHPELLDFLANQFVEGGWRIKPLHKMIVMSSAYRQSSTHPESTAGIAKDQDNRLLWRFPNRRLNAEEVRDAMLMIAGRLNHKAGGPSVILPVESDLVKLLYTPSQWTVTAGKKEHDRRSVYLLAKRNLRLPFMEAFDQPDAQTSCAKRESSTHALQALELLNGRFANGMAESFAERLRREAGDDPTRQVERAYLLAAGRPPSAKEKERAGEFLKKQPLKEFALAAFNLNGFLYVK